MHFNSSYILKLISNMSLNYMKSWNRGYESMLYITWIDCLFKLVAITVGKWSSHAIHHWRRIRYVYHILLVLIYHCKSTEFHMYDWKQNCFIWLANTMISMFVLSFCYKSCSALNICKIFKMYKRMEIVFYEIRVSKWSLCCRRPSSTSAYIFNFVLS